MKRVLLVGFIAVNLAWADTGGISDEDIVTDKEFNVIWSKKAVKKTWNEAFEYCKNLNLFGHSDWGVPNVAALLVLSKNKSHNNILAWSSVAFQSFPFAVDLSNGERRIYSRESILNVVCMRDNSLKFTSLDLFLSHIDMASDIQDLVLPSNKIYRLEHNGTVLRGTKYSILKRIKYQSTFSKTPFISAQQLSQKKLNEYLTLPLIPKPTIPAALNLIKDEFESKAEFAERVQKESVKRETIIAALQEDYRKKVEERNGELEKRKANVTAMKKIFLFGSLQDVMGVPNLSAPTFDPETNIMYVTVFMSNAEWSKKVAIPMSDKEVAKAFKENISKATPSVTFGYENDSFVLRSIDVGFEDKKYIATLTDKDYQAEKVAVVLESKKVEFSALQNPNLTDRYQVQALGYSESAGAKGLKYNDDLTPLAAKLQAIKPDGKKWLFAVAIEKYDEADPVAYAANSGRAFVSAAQKRLGIDARHTYSYMDDKATSGAIKDNLTRMLENVQNGDTIYFYYSGHGIPSSIDGEAFILPKDKIADYITKEKEFMARNIYKQLSDSKASKVVAFIDSCYSGRTDGIANMKGVAAGVFKTKKVEFDTSKMVVITAGTNGQFSNAYPEKGHRLFTYYLTKSLIERPTLDINSIYQDIAVKVKDESWKMGDNKRQEPQIEGNVGLGL